MTTPIARMPETTQAARTPAVSTRGIRGLLRKEAPSSYAYRLYTLVDALGFLIVGITSLQTLPFQAGTSSVFFNELAKLFAGMIVPGYLIWRNVTTFRARQPMLSERLLVTGPWYFGVAVLIIWAQVAATLVLPVLSRFAAGDIPVMQGTLAFDVDQLWRSVLWFGGPAIFIIEICVARERGAMAAR